ncbi:MAG TPA: 2-C-methyl-D-erythritol 2,4-cyclodiphosphate synthase [Ruminococcaceae bacterium]|nr:2-C-methyl-D-erythritol 2,4-cyclodiphosphate synthase [Oscillospiraceae bacterium]
MRIGHGYDVHRLVKGRPLVIGGVIVPYEKGELGHSDGDVLLHAICDALLGAAAIGDIGQFFPDSDSKYKNCDSALFLRQVCEKVMSAGYKIQNIDATVILQNPRISGYMEQIRYKVAEICSANLNDISIKATTEEGLGFTGSGEGIAAHAVCLID